MDKVRAIGRQMTLLYPKLLRGLQDPSIPRLKLTSTQLIILVTLYDLRQCKVTTLAREKGVALPTVTGIVNRLVQARFVRRERDRRDRRIVWLSLTSKGTKMVADILKLVDQRWQNIASRLSDPERKAYLKILRRVAQVLSAESRG